MAKDTRLKLKVKAALDSCGIAGGYGLKLGNYLAKHQGLVEDFMGASAASIGSNKSVITSARLNKTWTAAYIANDADAAPTFSGEGIAVTSKNAENDGVIFYSEFTVPVPEASSNDKLVFEALFNLTTVANCDEAGFIISNESTSNLDADTTFLDASDSYLGININNGSIELVHNLNGGTAVQTDTGLDVADGVDVHVKIEIDDDRKGTVYVNGKRISTVGVMTFDAGEVFRMVFGALVDATAALGTINIKEVAAYKLLSGSY